MLKSILLIDDDEPTNYLNKRIIESSGCCNTIYVCQTAIQALEFLQTPVDGYYPQPDLIFLDINMPGMNGWRFLEAYSALAPEQKGNIVIIMLTTSLSPEDRIRPLARGNVSGFETKPLTRTAFSDILNTHFAIEA